MHSHNMAAVTLSQYKSKKDSTSQQLSHCVRICVSSFFRLRERCVIFSYARKMRHRIELERRLVFIVRSTARCVSGLDCLYRHRIKLEQRLLLTTSRPIKHLRLRVFLAWFLHLAAAKVTKRRPWPPHVFPQDFFR